LGIYFGTGPDLWLTMQAKYELRLLQRDRGAAIAEEIRRRRAA
jgi:plasmid maintenance system antidote protein VapI